MNQKFFPALFLLLFFVFSLTTTAQATPIGNDLGLNSLNSGIVSTTQGLLNGAGLGTTSLDLGVLTKLDTPGAIGIDLNGWYTANDQHFQLPGRHDVPAPVPEPATLLLIGAGLASYACFRKKFHRG